MVDMRVKLLIALVKQSDWNPLTGTLNGTFTFVDPMETISIYKTGNMLIGVNLKKAKQHGINFSPFYSPDHEIFYKNDTSKLPQDCLIFDTCALALYICGKN